ncbi:hypothetical protein CPB83DRAFT_842977 [Crepidotus variabilis]|uniref:Uncharacterized protein n=1 Tax=Crepidotus variabilis TaxID=179855 RepID=A0A9P6ETX7_9AGAR|nr:hypothetical protein CPB83DRAFT_842977 [Crepidotus variabilis]
MCYSAGSISQAVNPCPMCKVYSHTKCPHIRETCRNRTAHPRMDVLYLKNAEVESFNGCGYCKWANQEPPPKQTGYNNPGWPGCCRAPYQNEINQIPIADWHAVSIVHKVPIPSAIEDILNSFSLPPLPFKTVTNKQPMSPTGSLRSSTKSSTSSSRKTSGAAAFNGSGNNVASSGTPSKSNGASSKPSNSTIGRGRQGTIVAGSNAASRSSSSHALPTSTSAPNSPAMAENGHARRKSSAADKEHKRNGDGSNSNHSSPSRRSLEVENSLTTPRRVSSVRRPVPTPATTSVSVSKVIASDTREIKAHDGLNGTIGRRGSSASTSNRPSSRTGDSNFLLPRSSKADDDCRSSSSGSSDGMLSDSTMRSEGFTDYLSDESEEELQRQAEAKAAVVAQNQMEELEFKMARQQLAHVGLKPPKSWTETNSPPVSPSKKQHSPMPSPRNPNIPTHSFAVAATAMMQTGQARG